MQAMAPGRSAPCCSAPRCADLHHSGDSWAYVPGRFCSPLPTHLLHCSVRRPVRRAALPLTILVIHFLASSMSSYCQGKRLLFWPDQTIPLTAHMRWTDLPATVTNNSFVLLESPSFHRLVALCMPFKVLCLSLYPGTCPVLHFPPQFIQF